MKGSKPDFVRLARELAAEGLTPVKPPEGIFFAVIYGEGQFVELGNPMALPVVFLMMLHMGTGGWLMHHRGRGHDGPVEDGRH